MTTQPTTRQAALDAILDLITRRLEAALDLVAAHAREQRCDELHALCTDLRVLAADLGRAAAQ